MVLPVSAFFGNVTKSSSKPILNSFPISMPSGSRYGVRRLNSSQFWKDFRSNPELMSPISIMCTDICGDRPMFYAPDGNELGRNKRMEAERFWRDNRGKETIKAMLFDMFVTGDGYVYKGYATAENRMKAVKEIANKFSMLSKEQHNELMIKAVQDEDLKKPKKFDYIASSTMTIINDNYDILEYVQNCQGLTSKYKPSEVIHFRLNTVNGIVNGYTPVESLVNEIALLWLVKGNMIAVMEGGGSPDKIFILPKAIADDPNHKLMVQTLEKYKSVVNWHGTLVFTGEVDVKEIGGTVKDLEYKDLALYITSNIAYAFGVPVTRIPYLVGSSATKGDSGGMAESGYWNRISELQDMLEDLLNSQLFESLGFHIYFNRKYKQDEVRESQILSMNADTITKMQTIYLQNKKKVKTQKINEILGLSEDDLEDASPDELMMPMQKTGLMNQNMLSNNNVNKEPDNRKKADTKRNVANDKGVTSAGV